MGAPAIQPFHWFFFSATLKRETRASSKRLQCLQHPGNPIEPRPDREAQKNAPWLSSAVEATQQIHNQVQKSWCAMDIQRLFELSDVAWWCDDKCFRTAWSSFAFFCLPVYTFMSQRVCKVISDHQELLCAACRSQYYYYYTNYAMIKDLLLIS